MFIKEIKHLLKDLQPTYVGHEAESNRGVLTLKYPVEHSIITNWDDIEVLWAHTFRNELAVSPEEHPVLLTEAPLNPKANREKLTQVMFETFNTPGLYVANTAAMSLLASGRKTGTVFESGHGISMTVPVYEGHNLPHAIPKLNLCGRDLTFYMMSLLSIGERHLPDKNSFKVCRDIKETLCYVAQDFEKEMVKPSTYFETMYTDPATKELMTVGNERFRCPEAMFQPNGCGFGYVGIPLALSNTIMKCDADIREELYGNIVLSGGSTLFPGFPERLQAELSLLSPKDIDVKVIAEPKRKHAAWLGGSIYASSSDFRQSMMTKEEYDEFGPGLVHRKCF